MSENYYSSGLPSILREMDNLMSLPLRYSEIEVPSDVQYDIYTDEVGETEKKTHLFVKVFIGNASSEDIHVSHNKKSGVLTIECSPKKKEESETRKYLRRGISDVQFKLLKTLHKKWEYVKGTIKDEVGYLVLEFEEKEQKEVSDELIFD